MDCSSAKLRSGYQRTPYELNCSLIKPLVQSHCWRNIYFRERSRITDYCYSWPVVLSFWKSFFARFFSRYKLPCSMEKWIVTDSNCEPSGYEPDALTIAPTILSGFSIYLYMKHFYFRRTVTANVTCYPVANRTRRNSRI